MSERERKRRQHVGLHTLPDVRLRRAGRHRLRESEREREREIVREGERKCERERLSEIVCVCVCV